MMDMTTQDGFCWYLDLLSLLLKEMEIGKQHFLLNIAVLKRLSQIVVIVSAVKLNLFTPDSGNSKITVLGKVKNKQHHIKVLLNSFPMNGHTLWFS